jgi:hypothetical protein
MLYNIQREKIEDDIADHFIYRSKNECSQIIVCEVYRDICNHLQFAIHITTKRKKEIDYKTSYGKDGIKSLNWCRKCLLDFIEFAKHTYKDDTISIWPTDDKRRTVYKHYLLPLGFKMTQDAYKSFNLKL